MRGGKPNNITLKLGTLLRIRVIREGNKGDFEYYYINTNLRIYKKNRR